MHEKSSARSFRALLFFIVYEIRKIYKGKPLSTPSHFCAVKSPAGKPGFSGEGISFLMGCSKNYIMYWGGYVYYNSITSPKSVHKDEVFSIPFVVNFYSPIQRFPQELL